MKKFLLLVLFSVPTYAMEDAGSSEGVPVTQIALRASKRVSFNPTVKIRYISDGSPSSEDEQIGSRREPITSAYDDEGYYTDSSMATGFDREQCIEQYHREVDTCSLRCVTITSGLVLLCATNFILLHYLFPHNYSK